MSEMLLEVDRLSVSYRTGGGKVMALRNANIAARRGEVIGIVGESGCGKSTLASAIIGLMGANAEVTSGAVRYKETDLLSLSADGRRRVRGRNIAMVFQDPMTSFNPVFTIGEQLIDFQHHLDLPSTEKRERALAMLRQVGIPDARECLKHFPHELSGGMRQRAAIAAALLMKPDILIADEPTAALDVTMEAQIIHLLRELRNIHQGAIIVVTHHLGVVAELCDRVYVMYAGEVVEEALVDDLFHAPAHPYTRALLACDPAHLEERTTLLPTIPGHVPDLATPIAGCSFADRCSLAAAVCRTAPPFVKLSTTQSARCHMVQR